MNVSVPSVLAPGSSSLRVVAALAVAALLTLPLAVFAAEVSGLRHYLGTAYPPGQATYIMMRPVGSLAFVLVFLQIVLGSAHRPLAARLGTGPLLGLHRAVGGSAAALALLHPLLFLGARTLRTGAFDPAATFLPRPTDYYHTHLFAGAIALYALWFAVLAARFGPRLAPRYWRRIHAVNYAVFFAAAYHSFFIGSDTRHPVFAALYAALTGAAALLLLRRLGSARAPNESAAQRAH